MSVLLQISDPHFGTEQPPVVEALAALARQQRPDLLVLSGDITQRARPAQFQAARAFMERGFIPGLLPHRAMGPLDGRAGLRSRRGDPSPAGQGMTLQML